jgi:hypothetical protein
MEGDIRNIVFCNFGLLRTPGRLERIVKLLPQARQAEVRSLIESAKGVSIGELKNQLNRCRVDAVSNALEQASRQINGRSELAPIAFQRWIVALGQQSNGREDH